MTLYEYDLALSAEFPVIAGADDAQAQEEARQEEARNIQWWVFVAAGGAAAAAAGLGLYLKKRTGGRHSQ